MTQWINTFSGTSLSNAGQPKNVWIDVQKMMVKIQKTEIQVALKYHLKADSVSIQKVNPPNINNKIGNAIFIAYPFPRSPTVVLVSSSKECCSHAHIHKVMGDDLLFVCPEVYPKP